MRFVYLCRNLIIIRFFGICIGLMVLLLILIDSGFCWNWMSGCLIVVVVDVGVVGVVGMDVDVVEVVVGVEVLVVVMLVFVVEVVVWVVVM